MDRERRRAQRLPPVRPDGALHRADAIGGVRLILAPRRKSGRSRLDYKAAASEATAKGSTGDQAVKGLLEGLGWDQVADLSRTYPGADLLAICACPKKHLLWVEVKTYRYGKIEPDSWMHLVDRAQSASERAREGFALFTYQRRVGGRNDVPEWFASYGIEELRSSVNHRPFISRKERFAPECGGGHPMADEPNRPAPPWGLGPDPNGGD